MPQMHLSAVVDLQYSVGLSILGILLWGGIGFLLGYSEVGNAVVAEGMFLGKFGAASRGC